MGQQCSWFFKSTLARNISCHSHRQSCPGQQFATSSFHMFSQANRTKFLQWTPLYDQIEGYDAQRASN